MWLVTTYVIGWNSFMAYVHGKEEHNDVTRRISLSIFLKLWACWCSNLNIKMDHLNWWATKCSLQSIGCQHMEQKKWSSADKIIKSYIRWMRDNYQPFLDMMTDRYFYTLKWSILFFLRNKKSSKNMENYCNN